MKSRNSIATLACVPPPTYQTPSVTFCDSTRTGADALHQVPVVNPALHPVPTVRHGRYGPDASLALFAPFDSDRVRPWCQRGFEAAMRREPDLELELFGVGRREHNDRTLHVPG